MQMSTETMLTSSPDFNWEKMQDNYIYLWKPALPGLSEYAIFFVKNWGQIKTNARFSKQFHLGASAALLALLGRHSHRSTAPLCPQSHRRTFQTNPIKDGLQIQTNTNTNTPKQINCSTLLAKSSSNISNKSYKRSVSSPSSTRAKSFPSVSLSSHQERTTRSRQYLYFTWFFIKSAQADNQKWIITYIKS